MVPTRKQLHPFSCTPPLFLFSASLLWVFERETERERLRKLCFFFLSSEERARVREKERDGDWSRGDWSERGSHARRAIRAVQRPGKPLWGLRQIRPSYTPRRSRRIRHRLVCFLLYFPFCIRIPAFACSFHLSLCCLGWMSILILNILFFFSFFFFFFFCLGFFDPLFLLFKSKRKHKNESLRSCLFFV